MSRFDANNGHLGVSSVESLYSYVQKVYLKSRKGEEKFKMLRIAIEAKTEVARSLDKVLCLQITDDNDCIFFFSLLLTQDDFSILKSQQGLLVDFDHFPFQLIKLLEACRSQEVANKFILVLDEEDSLCVQIPIEHDKNYFYLKVIETNNFKNLCHLSLKVKQGSDSDIKSHMTLKISVLNEKLMETTKKCEISEKKLDEALKALESKTKELNQLQLKIAEETNYLKLETSHQISEEREKIAKMQIEWQQRLDSEKALLVTQHQKQINDFNEQINLLTFNNKNLYESRCQLETSVKEKTFQMEALEKQLMQLTQENSLLKKKSSQLDQDYHEKDKMVISLKTKLAVMEQELKDKVKFIDKQQELLKSANEQKVLLEEALSEKELHLQQKKTAIQTLSADLMKYNDIITKLQTELGANKAKIKLRTNIALEQEKVLEKKVQHLMEQTKTIQQLNEKILNLEEDLKNSKKELKEAVKKIEEREMTIKKNDNVINWLNRRLTECSSGASCSPNLMLSGKMESDFTLANSHSKGGILNLTKGWPPWLINSVAGCNSSRCDTTGPSNCISYVPPQVSSTCTDMQLTNSVNSAIKRDVSTEQELQKSGDLQLDYKKESGGLDPKYFQSSIDKDFITNPLILKKKYIPTDNLEVNKASKITKEKKQISAYFLKTAQTQN